MIAFIWVSLSKLRLLCYQPCTYEKITDKIGELGSAFKIIVVMIHDMMKVIAWMTAFLVLFRLQIMTQ